MSFLKSKDQIKRCPRTGKIIESTSKSRWPWWLIPFIGLAALIWFLIRVIPKPSRAAYPCQRMAFPLASGFVAWILGLIGSAAAYRKAKAAFSQARYVAAAVFLAVSFIFVWTTMTGTEEKTAYAHEPMVSNSPMGQGKGIFPGRVAWIHDSNATSWTGSDGSSSPPFWYDDSCTDQTVVNEMLSKALHALTGRDNDTNAWDAIFRNFNHQMGRGYVGYTPGEKIAIKINFVLMYGVNDGNKPSGTWDNRHDQIGNSPQLTKALLRQLIDVAGVSPGDISMGDPTQGMPNYWYNMVEPNCPGVVYLTKSGYFLSGRTQVSLDTNSPFYWSDPCEAHFEGVTEQDYIPSYFSQADYFINFPVLKSHTHSGITIGGKNHYGSLRIPNAYGYYDMHHSRVLPEESPGMHRYRANVDLLGHPRLGGKTMLTLIDGLYSGRGWDSRTIRWDMAPFNGDWPSSIILSQDKVAVDSVAFDFMDNEWDDSPDSINGYPQMSGADDYLHEAAMVPDPCSGTVYDPNNDGGLTDSLGVHEHWNNVTDRQYSRNLDPVNGTGIELVTEPGIVGDFYRDEVVDFQDFAVFAAAWGTEPGDTDWNTACDLFISGTGVINEYDLAALSENWLQSSIVED